MGIDGVGNGYDVAGEVVAPTQESQPVEETSAPPEETESAPPPESTGEVNETA